VFSRNQAAVDKIVAEPRHCGHNDRDLGGIGANKLLPVRIGAVEESRAGRDCLDNPLPVIDALNPYAIATGSVVAPPTGHAFDYGGVGQFHQAVPAKVRDDLAFKLLGMRRSPFCLHQG